MTLGQANCVTAEMEYVPIITCALVMLCCAHVLLHGRHD